MNFKSLGTSKPTVGSTRGNRRMKGLIAGAGSWPPRPIGTRGGMAPVVGGPVVCLT